MNQFPTHEVTNQSQPLEDINPATRDTALMEGIEREGAGWARDALTAFGERIGSAEVQEWGRSANAFRPQLKTHDCFGRRDDTVTYHPAYHQLMALAKQHLIHASPWLEPRPGAHVARIAKHYLFNQAESGITCPITMTFAVVPALRRQPELARAWEAKLFTPHHDPRFLPISEKQGCTMGMAMTEKQGGSDVRSNTTRAVPLEGGGPGTAYLLYGHKWFCSAPMSDAFLTLAQTEKGLSCFLLPRFRPDGTRNPFYLQRLKDKVGNWSNASSEVEYHETWATMVGEEGRGVPTIIEMVNHTRLDCISGTAGLMRWSLHLACHHARHRAAFGQKLWRQPLMRNVLADMSLEVEATTAFLLRLARAYDEDTQQSRLFARLATAVGKYWVCKRGPGLAFEAMECHGGAGYVEENPMARIYREMPLCSIWEGSGNVMCLDVLRAMVKEPHGLEALLVELEKARGGNNHYDDYLDKLTEHLGRAVLQDPDQQQRSARRLVEDLALALQAALLVQAHPEIGDIFCASRLGGGGFQYGTLPESANLKLLLERALPD